jgi:tetratricopeptide (TPR) repeat protein
MKKRILFYSFIISIIASGTVLFAQLKTPAASPFSKISQVVGINEVTIEYSRPGVKNRVVFGGLVPYGKIWRTGANASTIITLNDDAVIEGNKVPAGKYSIYTIPDKKDWVIILNKNLKGGMTYPEGQDLCRFKVKPKALKESVETFSAAFTNVKYNSADVEFQWEKTLVKFNILFDVDKRVMEQIDAGIGKSGLDANWYYSAGNYYFENGKDLNKALQWLNKSLELNPGVYYVLRVKSQVQAKLGDYKGAIETAELGKVKSADAKNDQFVKYNEDSIKEWKKALDGKKTKPVGKKGK